MLHLKREFKKLGNRVTMGWFYAFTVMPEALNLRLNNSSEVKFNYYDANHLHHSLAKYNSNYYAPWMQVLSVAH